jgi:hypothetical protein
MSDLILNKKVDSGKYFGPLRGITGKFFKGILASLGVLLPFFLLQLTQAVTIFVQQVGELLRFHTDFGIT